MNPLFPKQSQQRRSEEGLAYGIAAYGLWGLIPLYFKLVVEVGSLEVLAHRALWACVMLAIVLGLLGRYRDLGRSLRNGKVASLLAVSALLVAATWLTFIYAVQTRQVIQASLGYFMNPLVNVLLGVVFLRERLRPWQIVSVVLAIVGVAVLTAWVGQFPWIPIILAVSTALYALLRKTTPVDSLLGVAVETLFITPFALAYLAYLFATGHAQGNSVSLWGLLMLSGPATSIPLLLFGGAARRLQLSTLGFVQYLTPPPAIPPGRPCL
jgi:chloramphenicol-sensitive protein RarD